MMAAVGNFRDSQNPAVHGHETVCGAHHQPFPSNFCYLHLSGMAIE
jgi:hypothetical protein